MPRKRLGHQGATDANQPDIVKALRKIPGCKVIIDMDDILVGFRGRNYWFEIKDPEKALNKDRTWKKGALKPSQVELSATWPGQYNIVTSIEEIVAIIGA